MPDLTDAEMADALLWLATITVHAVRMELAGVEAMMTRDGLLALLAGPPKRAGERLGTPLGRSIGLLDGLDRRLAENWTPPTGRERT